MTCPKCNHAHAGPALAFICVGCPCPETPGKAEWLAKRRAEPCVFRAVIFAGETRAHVARQYVDDDDEEMFFATTLCGTGGMAVAVGGLHDRYCQTCLSKLGMREVAP